MKIIGIVLSLILLFTSNSKAQSGKIAGKIKYENQTIELVTVIIKELNLTSYSNSQGSFEFNDIHLKSITLQFSHPDFLTQELYIDTINESHLILNVELKKKIYELDEFIVTGTLKEVNKLDCTVPVEIYSPTFFKKNPTPTIFDALQNINGVRPQVNCNICNTGDIHINGLEGPYTMVLIDGMPIVSSLSTVYSLSGIPNALVERIEIVKGPSSSLFGSEAIGGIINIITKKPQNSPTLSLDVFSTSYLEHNIDIGLNSTVSKNASVLTGINYFKYGNKVDKNHDNFTDVTLQDRISIFQKWDINRKNSKIFTLAGRFFYEDRWGGEMNWNKKFRGGDSIYGESIYTTRYELLGKYQLPTKEKLILSFSFNQHDQNSRYGIVSYNAIQKITFVQLTWDKKIKKHDLLSGAAVRYTFYDDNTPVTQTGDSLHLTNSPSKSNLPGLFIQDEITITEKQKLLIGFRADFNSIHGLIYTPRLGYKFNLNAKNILRLNCGTGFRIVNLFTEDHAALTGARTIEIKSALKPERSYNLNFNYIKLITIKNNSKINIDATCFYTYFNNRIIGDYETDPNKIIYDNLNGYAVSKGISMNTSFALLSQLKFITGATFMDVASFVKGIKQQQILSEKFTATWSISYSIKKIHLELNYTGNLYSPMRLPLMGIMDPRAKYSPWWSIQNIQFIYSGFKKWEIYAGIKNLLNWTPNKNNPFIIARANDPFDKQVQFDSSGKAISTVNNPYGLTFDPTYVYAPNQGIRGFLGVRFKIK